MPQRTPMTVRMLRDKIDEIMRADPNAGKAEVCFEYDSNPDSSGALSSLYIYADDQEFDIIVYDDDWSELPFQVERHRG